MQIHAYLKTVAFRRDINEVQKAAAGKGMGGIPSARIASEANREYIFSTSFQPENHKNEIDREVSPNVCEDNQEHDVATKGIQSSQMFPRKLNQTASDEVAVQKFSEKALTVDSPSDNDIEWEDEDITLSVCNQPIKGVTVEINETDLVSEGVDLQKLFTDIDPYISKEKYNKCKNYIPDREGKDVDNDEVDEIMAPVEGDSEIEWEEGSMYVASKGMVIDETISGTMTEIEGAELEEAMQPGHDEQQTEEVQGVLEREMEIGLAMQSLRESDVTRSSVVVRYARMSRDLSSSTKMAGKEGH